MLRWTLISATAMLLVGCSEPPSPPAPPQPDFAPRVNMSELGVYDAQGWHPPLNGLVADSETAIRVAQVYLGPLVPADWARDLRNWSAEPQGEDEWLVGVADQRCPPPGLCVGGGWMISIAKADGRVTGLYAGQ